MLESLRLIDFKSFVDETIPFAPVTYLLGASSAGKSNALDALRFLRALPFEGPQVPFLDGPSHGVDATAIIRGGAQETARFGTDSFAIHSAWTFSDGPGRRSTVDHSVRCQVTPTIRLLEERLVDERGKTIAGSSDEASGSPGSSILDVARVSSHPCAERLSIALTLLTFIDVHPELFQRAYHDRQIQVVATVQDASLLRWLDDEHLARVVLLARTPDRPGTAARRLGDLPGFFGAFHTLGLEQMLATQWLEASL